MQGLYTAVKKSRFEDILGKYWLAQNTFAQVVQMPSEDRGVRVETLETLESCGRPSEIPVRAVDSLVLGPLGVES